jgi:hypothetical protein
MRQVRYYCFCGRSALSDSLSCNTGHDDRVALVDAYPASTHSQQPFVRPVTSLGVHSHRSAAGIRNSAPRRSWEEKVKTQRDVAPQDEWYHREYTAVDRMRAPIHLPHHVA